MRAIDGGAGVRMRFLMRFEGDPAEPRWDTVNDGVMGGRSSGAMTIVGGQLRFDGVLSLADNGGFASVRTRHYAADLSAGSAIVLRVRGDGRDYQLRLKTDAMFRALPVAYAAPFSPPAGQWAEVRVRFDGLQARVRGTVLDGPPFDATRVSEVGLLIGDRREGAFSIVVDWIGVE